VRDPGCDDSEEREKVRQPPEFEDGCDSLRLELRGLSPRGPPPEPESLVVERRGALLVSRPTLLSGLALLS